MVSAVTFCTVGRTGQGALRCTKCSSPHVDDVTIIIVPSCGPVKGLSEFANRRRQIVNELFESVTSLPVSGRSVCVYLYVCALSQKPKTKCPNFTKLSVRVACGRDLVFLWQQCNTLCTSGFVNDVMFSQFGANAVTRQQIGSKLSFSRILDSLYGACWRCSRVRL